MIFYSVSLCILAQGYDFFVFLKDVKWIKKEDMKRLKELFCIVEEEKKEEKSMDIDDDEDENKNEHIDNDNNQGWSDKILFVENSDSMCKLLKQLIDSENNEKYNWGINFCINKFYDLIRSNAKKEIIDKWLDPLNNVMLSMINKFNRDQIAFVKLIYEIFTTNNIDETIAGLSVKLNGITVPSFNGLYALFQCCFSKLNQNNNNNKHKQDENKSNDKMEVDNNNNNDKINKKSVIKLVNTMCNHLYSVIFARQRECEKKVKKMHDNNEMYQEKYANIIYKNYAEQDSLLNLFIHQNNLIEKVDLFTYKGHGSMHQDTHQHIKVLHRYIQHLTNNIKFNFSSSSSSSNNKEQQELIEYDFNKDYLFPNKTDTHIKLFCDNTTKFLFDIFCNEIMNDFMNIISPLIIGLIHSMYSRAKNKKYVNQSKFLFISFKGNKYYQFILTSSIQSNKLIDDEFCKLIKKNMNKLLTFMYFVYFKIWNDNCNDICILHKSSDILLAKGKESEALQLLIDESNSFYVENKIKQQINIISKEYGLLFCNEKLFAHFIHLCFLNKKKFEAVLLWQLSTDQNRLKYALNIIQQKLTKKDLKWFVSSKNNKDINVFEFIWEPIIFCAIKDKFSTKSKKIDNKLNQYLDCFEMGTDSKIKASKMCDFILNNLFLSL